MKELAQGLYPSLHSVFIKGPGSIFIHADGTISFRVYHKSDAGSIQQSEDKLLEYLGVVIYEALDWGIDSQVERELSDPLDRLLCLMLKLDDEGMKPTVTLQDVIKACEDHLSVPSEATSHYKMTCRSLFTEFMELQKLVSIIQSAKECLKKMDEEDLLETHMQKKEKQWASPWPSIICELQNGVKLRKAAERPQHPVPLKERTYSPYELLLDDIRHKRYKLRKVLEWKLKDCVPREPTLHKQLMAEIKQPQKLQPSSVLESSRGPKEMSVIPNVALKKSLNDSLTSQDAHAAFQIVNTMAQRARSGVQEVTPKLPSSTQLASARSSVASYNSTGLAADHTLPPMSTPMLGDLQPNGFLNAGQQQLHPCRGRSKSLDTGLQSKELDCYFPTTKQSPTIAELIGTRYAMIMLQREGCSQGGSDGVFPRGKGKINIEALSCL
ncbi:hypothetical protein ASZ78_014492 [Callipepla squamata]|uniref:KIND domain-containing protein n=1 Tax=Callipepla squamata TaxID=9009 RepID=A0A226N4M0_CALSU|nr:hypothetical protein ASZ78_014492 [Callipepla squamata]